VHALDEDEKCKVSVHLGECSRCHAEVNRYEHVLGLLGHPDRHDDTTYDRKR
jgi:anti-sigma factor ChrR (cupin superfamily)